MTESEMTTQMTNAAISNMPIGEMFDVAKLTKISSLLILPIPGSSPRFNHPFNAAVLLRRGLLRFYVLQSQGLNVLWIA